MSLPNPSMSFDPFDPLPASELNDLVENDQALAAGTGLNSNAITTAKIADNNVTASKLATNAIKLGYAQITSNVGLTGGAIRFVTGLTSTVTIPSGGRSIEITAFATSVGTDASGSQACTLSIWDGTVGSGTQLSQSQNFVSTGTSAFIIAKAIVTPSAGSKTYNIGAATSGGNPTVAATSTAPAFILIKVI